MTHDPINRPSHYAEGRQFEPISVIEDWELNYRLGNAVKYISRAGRKVDAVEDLRKAVWYLQREIETLEGKKSQYAVTYNDVLEMASAEAALGSDLAHSHELFIPREISAELDVDNETTDWWDIDDCYMWDPSVGPVEISQEEIDKCLKKKDLDQFEADEIVSTFERRGIIFGVKKNGSTFVLNPESK